MVVSVFVLLLSAAASTAEQTAHPEIVRLAPRDFPRMPATVADDAHRRGCTIPQAYTNPRPHNVISGRFRDRNHMDWAVLCSRDGRSAILIYWSGSPGDVAELADLADGTYDIGGGRSGYGRFIATARPARIEHNCRVSEAPSPECPVITHDGIDDGLAEKGSRIHYFDGARWHELPGAD
jgi:hypothetical protein